MNKVKVTRGRQSKKNKLQRDLFEAKLKVKDLSASPTDMFKYMEELGIELTADEVVTFLKMQVTAVQKHRSAEMPMFLVNSTENTVRVTYADTFTIILRLNSKQVTYCTCTCTVHNSIFDSGLLSRILREMPV